MATDQADHEIQRCRAALAAGDLAHAAAHVGSALVHDPALGSAYACLEDLAAAAGSSEAARELFKGDGTSVSPGNAAAIIALLAAEGRVADAVEVLGSVVAAGPALPWAAAPWFSPELAASLPEVSIGRALSSVWQAVGNPAPAEAVEALRPWLDLARAAAPRPGLRPDVLCTASALARRLGAYQEAIAWCVTAEEREKQSGGRPSQNTLIMLGYAHRDAGDADRAIQAWTRATALKPVNADLLLDLADITFDAGDFAQSLRWAERAAAADRDSPKVRAALLAARFRTGGVSDGLVTDVAPLIELVDLAAAHPQMSYIRRRLSQACQGAAWLRIVPPPTEAICAAYGNFAQTEDSGEGKIVSGEAHVVGLEAPTPMMLFRQRFPQVALQVAPLVEPDLRVPVRTEFGPPLWSYDGTTAVATVQPPSARALELVHDIAKGVWADPLTAYEAAAGFGALDAADLLGLLAHMPAPREASWVRMARERPLYWQRLAQVWVCVGVLHHRPEQPWATSVRRALLLRLLFGAEDWTVDAAAFALCVSAWRFPAQRAEIADAITQRYLHAAKAVGQRPTQLHEPLARVLLICPDVDPQVAHQARAALGRQGEAVPATGGEALQDSLLRRWKRRREG